MNENLKKILIEVDLLLNAIQELCNGKKMMGHKEKNKLSRIIKDQVKKGYEAGRKQKRTIEDDYLDPLWKQHNKLNISANAVDA